MTNKNAFDLAIIHNENDTFTVFYDSERNESADLLIAAEFDNHDEAVNYILDQREEYKMATDKLAALRSMIDEAKQLEEQANDPSNFDSADGISMELESLSEAIHDEIQWVILAVTTELQKDFVSDICLTCDEDYIVDEMNGEPKIFADYDKETISFKFYTQCGHCGFKYILKEVN